MGLTVRARESLLSTASGYNNYRGILNLCVILLVLSNARAALENVMKYGILVDPVVVLRLMLNNSPSQWPAIEIILSLNIFIISSLLIEKFIFALDAAGKSTKRAPNSTGHYIGLAMIVINLFTLLSLPPFIIFNNSSHPVATSFALLVTCMVFLKLVSYHTMMFWCRDVKRPLAQQSPTTQSFLRSCITPRSQFEVDTSERQDQTDGKRPEHTNGKQQRAPEPQKQTPEPQQQVPAAGGRKANGTSSPKQATTNAGQADVCLDDSIRQMYYDISEPYPRNLNLLNMYYFMVAPTLCYEFEFARTSRIRKHFLLKRAIEAIILSQLMLALIQQWIVPTVNNSLLPFRQMQYSHMLERLLKLAVPNHVIWLISFYLFFHSLLNILAELTRFADREFYLDWWNSESVNYFWRCWNIPVHKWCARHLYVPLMAFGWSRFAASTAVFFVSAFFHEYLVSVPLQIFRYWAFFGMLMQLPLARFVSVYLNNQFANVAVWITLIIGQPLCILMYYHDYYVINKITA